MTQYEAIDFVRAIKKVARTFPEGINQFMMFGEETIAKYALEEMKTVIVLIAWVFLAAVILAVIAKDIKKRSENEK